MGARWPTRFSRYQPASRTSLDFRGGESYWQPDRGRVFLFLHTDDFWRDHGEMLKRGVKFVKEPRQETYGTVAVFEDLYGNKWDLLELKTPTEGGQS
jgi:hypothetical protein